MKYARPRQAIRLMICHDTPMCVEDKNRMPNRASQSVGGAHVYIHISSSDAKAPHSSVHIYAQRRQQQNKLAWGNFSRNLWAHGIRSRFCKSFLSIYMIIDQKISSV